MSSNDGIEHEKARSRGILSGADRKRLMVSREEFVEEHSRQYWGQRRDEIRDRVRDAILDFTILFDHLDDGEYDAIFGDLENDSELRYGIQHALAFLFLGTRTIETGVAPKGNHPEWARNPEFDELLEQGYLFALLRYDFLVEEFDPPEATGIHIEGIRTVREMAESGQDLSPRLIQLLLSSDAIDAEPVQEAIREQVLEDITPHDDEE